MVQAELQKYITEQMAQGVSMEEIKKAVLTSGWNEKDVADTMAAMKLPATPVAETKSDKAPATKTPANMKMIAGVVAAVLVVAGIVGVLAYFNYTNSPTYVVNKMLTSEAKADSMEIDGSMDINVTTAATAGSPSLAQKITFGFSGGIDTKDINNPKGSGNISINYQGMLAKPVSADIVYVNKTLYFKLNDAPNLGSQLPLAQLNGKWFYVPESELKALATASTTVMPTATMTVAQKKQLTDALTKNKVLVVKEAKADEVVNGVSTHHYVYAIDKNAVIPFMKDYAKVTNETFTSAEEKSLQDSLDKIGDITGELWIGKTDYMPYKMTVTVGMKPDESLSAGSVSMTFNVKSINKAITVTAPSGATIVDQLMQEFSY